MLTAKRAYYMDPIVCMPGAFERKLVHYGMYFLFEWQNKSAKFMNFRMLNS